MDIFIDLPGIAEAVVAPANRAACLDKIRGLAMELQQWRWDWHAANAARVRLVQHASPEESSSASRAGSSVISEILRSASLNFDTPRLALDILYYNAALAYLMQLETVARGHIPRPEALSPDDERFIRRQAAQSLSGTGNPLLLPSQVRFICQPAMEAFMTIPSLTKLLATTPGMETVVTPAPIGIVYWVLRDQLQFDRDGHLAALLAEQPVLQDPEEKVFAGYFVSPDGRII